MGNRRALSRLISLAENGFKDARLISKELFPLTGNAYILGITGAPGTGKSTLTNKLVQLIVENGERVGVIAIDPTSPFSGGALLGDRIRMKDNYTNQNVFIRSMANRGRLGGMARATKDVITIMDAFGFDYIIIETVGVGQSEVDVYGTAHTTLVLVVPGMGDDIQAFKAGIMETSDLFVVNKMDLDGANKMVMEIESMLDLNQKVEVSRSKYENSAMEQQSWRPPVQKVNARRGNGIPALWEQIMSHRHHVESKGVLECKQLNRFKNELLDILEERFKLQIDQILDPKENPSILEDIRAITERKANPYSIAEKLGKRVIESLENGA
ncbi:methylmalonyl Co-A mutase-associated GTPase MeaB [Candidatus Bathyarchaeota archaeon]|nr:methylmalonyl Co-A mutase-associated GTPase MeaB [Candidatus Bathyarchaeota archaeon]